MYVCLDCAKRAVVVDSKLESAIRQLEEARLEHRFGRRVR